MSKDIPISALNGFFIGEATRKLMILFVLGFFSLIAWANPPLASKQQIGMFKNSKTCVVLDPGNIAYNMYISDAVKKYWKSTEYEFIDQKEFEKRRYDSKYSFLVLLKGVYDNDPAGISYNYLSLILGDKAYDIFSMPELCSIPISYSDDNSMTYGYAIPAIIYNRSILKNENSHLRITSFNYLVINISVFVCM